MRYLVSTLALMLLPMAGMAQSTHEPSLTRSLRLPVIINGDSEPFSPQWWVNKDQLALAKTKPVKHGRGHKPVSPQVSHRQHLISNAKHGNLLRNLPKATQAAYDALSAGVLPPIGDQGQCGNCYQWSGCKVCSSAQVVAGIVPKAPAGQRTNFMLATQFMLDCHPELGGCDGGDEYQVSQVIQSGGAPSTAQYQGAGQSPGRCQSVSGMTLYTVNNLVYVDPNQTNQGVASTQSIKNAILAYGYVSVAVAAGSDWDGADANTTITGNGTGIDHAVGATGWDDNHDNGDGTKGAFICDNQWGEGWANGGRVWIKYGADSFGYEAYIALAATPVPPAPPVPPVPPTPPTPPPMPSPIAPFSMTFDASNKIVTLPNGWAVANSVQVQGLDALNAKLETINAATGSKSTITVWSLFSALPDILNLVKALPGVITAIQSGDVPTINTAIASVDALAAKVLNDLGLPVPSSKPCCPDYKRMPTDN